MFERIIRFAIEHRWLVMLGVVAMAAIGIYNYQKLPIDAVPDITNVQVQINTSAAGYSPLEAEQRVTFPIETVMAGLPGLEPAAVDHVDSGALMLEAAARGHGIAFMLESHFETARDDRLVPLFDRAVDSTYSHWFVCRPRMLQQRPVKLFHDWLVQALGAPAE